MYDESIFESLDFFLHRLKITTNPKGDRQNFFLKVIFTV
jgi:hypothetical protein